MERSIEIPITGVFTCPRCGRIAEAWFDESIWECDICKHKKMVLASRAEVFEYDNTPSNNRDRLRDKLRINYCISSLEYDQDAWKQRVAFETGAARQLERELAEERAHPKPKCPTCGSTNVSRIGGLERGISVAMWGLFSKKINKSFKCNNPQCGYTW
jgi:ribosomal protein L37AE/L43A